MNQDEKIKSIDYSRFLLDFGSSSIYKKLRELSSQFLDANVFYTEFMLSFVHARIGLSDGGTIQSFINKLFLLIESDEEERKEFEQILKNSYLDVLYHVPDLDYISNYEYDSKLNLTIKKSPFESWILVGGEWKSPIPYPTDGKVYKWDESIKNWTVLN